jgi:hypothetical protein
VVGGAPKGDPALLPKAQATTKAALPAMIDARIVSTRCVLEKELDVAGIRPIAAKVVDNARITARLPDGRIEPLVWLYRFDPKTGITFHFREALALPPGTVVESTAPLRFALEDLAPEAEARR